MVDEISKYDSERPEPRIFSRRRRKKIRCDESPRFYFCFLFKFNNFQHNTIRLMHFSTFVSQINELRERISRLIKNQKAKLKKAPRWCLMWHFCVVFLWIFFFFVHLPVNLPNSSNISSLPFDFGMLPTKRRRLGTLTFIFKHLPGLISKLSSCSVKMMGREEEKIKIIK